MPRHSPAQTRFTTGEISPRLLGADDLQRYASALAECENFRIMPHGGITRRPGWHYVAECKDSTKQTRLLEFEHSVDIAYVIEASPLFFRFYRDAAQILNLGVPYEIATPYLEADLFTLQAAQNADVMYLANGSYWPRKLSRTSDTSWSLATVAFTDGPYLPDNATAITMTPSAAAGAITITASSAYFVAGMAPVGTEPGAYIRIKVGANPYGYAQITGYVSPTVVNATVKSTFTAAGASAVWSEGAWSTYRGFPRAVTFFEQRLYFGGTSYQPQTLWGSAVAAYEDFSPGVTDADPVTYTIASRKLNAIQWILGRDILFVGTSGSAYTAGDPTTPLTPTNVRVVPQTSHGGSQYLQPVEVGNVLLYMTRSSRKVREVSFDYRDNSYRGPDVSVLAEHITLGGIAQLAYSPEPDSHVYFVRNDGVSPVLTYDKEQDIVGWSRDTTDGLIESVACIPALTASGKAGFTQSWRVVQRTINGAVKRFVEYEEEPFDSDIDIADAFFVDCGLRYSGVSTAVLSGLGHLEGETVAVLAAGAVHSPCVVTGGQITLSYAVTKAAVGLAYTSRAVTLPGSTGSPDGTAQGKKKRWGRLKARVFRALAMLFNSQRVAARKTSDPLGSAIQPFTGTVQVTSIGWDEDAQVTIEQDQPLPATVLSLFGTQLVEDQ